MLLCSQLSACVGQHTRWRACHLRTHSTDCPASQPLAAQLSVATDRSPCKPLLFPQTLCLLTALLDRTSLANALLAALLQQYSSSVRVRCQMGGRMGWVTAQGCHCTGEYKQRGVTA